MTDTTAANPGSNSPSTKSFNYHPITLINEHPLPTSAEEAKEFWETNEQLQKEYVEPPHRDELHEKYTTTITKANQWHAFRIPLYGFEFRLYVWSSASGHGFWIHTIEDEHEALIELFTDLAEKIN